MSREAIEEAIEVLEDAGSEMLMETGEENYYGEAIAVLRQALETELRRTRVMDREEIIRMAREAGMQGMLTDVVCTHEELARFAALVAAAEREACASICFQEAPSIDGELIAEAIRARGEKA